MQKGKRIGEGNTAEVYLWGEEEIIKLFRLDFPMGGVEKEYRISKEVQKQGLPIPKVGQMFEFEGRLAITYERINGASMLAEMTRKIKYLVKGAKQLAEIHYKIHQGNIAELPKQKEALKWNIQHTDFLSEETKLCIIDYLEKLPEGDRICHGDYHPGNIIVNSKQAVVLDWMTATSGYPAADVARTLFLLRDAALPGYIPALKRVIIHIARNRMTSIYLKRYLQVSGSSKMEIRRWRLPILAARLTEWVPEKEKEYILKEINKSLSQKM